MTMENSEVYLAILNVVFLFAIAYFGNKWVKGKRILKKITEAVMTLDNIMEDDKVTDKEMHEAYEVFKDLYEELTGKEVLPPAPLLDE